MNILIYERTTDHYTAKGIIELLDKSLPHSTTATSQPTSVQDLVFIVDISKLDWDLGHVMESGVCSVQ